MKFELISINKQNVVELEWIMTKAEEITGNISMKVNSDPPNDTFIDALRGLNIHVAKIIGKDEESDQIEVRKVHMKYDMKVHGTYIVFSCMHESKSGPYAFNTPAILDISEDEKKRLPDGCYSDLKNLIFEAEQYADGYRKQTNLFYINKQEKQPAEQSKQEKQPAPADYEINEIKLQKIISKERFVSFKRSCSILSVPELNQLKELLNKKIADDKSDKKEFEKHFNLIRSLIAEKEQQTAA